MPWPFIERPDVLTQHHRLTVEFSSMGITHPNATASVPYNLGNDTNVLLDSGTTFIELDKGLASQIYADLNATFESSVGYYIVDCSARGMDGGLAVGFGNVSITIPFSDLIFTAEGLCAVGVQIVADGLQQVLGIPFFRAAYGECKQPSGTASTESFVLQL